MYLKELVCCEGDVKTDTVGKNYLQLFSIISRMDQIFIKTPNAKCRLFLKIYL